MITVKEARNLLNSLNTYTPVGHRPGKTASLLSLIESEGFEFPEKFTQAIEEASLIMQNVNSVLADGKRDLLDVASDPKKLRAGLDDIARRNALDGAVRTALLGSLMVNTTHAVVATVPDVMDQFITRHKDDPAYTQTGGTPGEEMLLQEKRAAINSVHNQLIEAGSAWVRPDSSEYFWLRWSWTPQQWAQVLVVYPNWEVPSVDQAAMSLGATHRFARSLAEASDEAEQCIDAVAEIEREAKKNQVDPWADNGSDRWVPVYAD